MGHETTLQALPESWEAIVQMRSGALKATEIQSVIHYFSWLRRNKDDVDPSIFYAASLDDAEYVSLLETAKHLLDSDRRYLWRFCDLDRKYAVLNFLLAEYAETPVDQKAFADAICGAEPFFKNATATQGHPIMWNDTNTTREIYSKLTAVEFADVIRHIRTEKYLNATLYKKGSGHVYELFLHEYFMALKEYYRLAAFNNCATAIVVD